MEFGSRSGQHEGRGRPVRRTLQSETPFLGRGQTCPRASTEVERGSDESRAERNRVCTSGDEVPGSDPPRREARGRPRDCDDPMRGRESTRDGKPDPETGVAPGFTRCRNMRSRCRCSMCPAIHINSRSWLRSSSTHEPSDPPLRVVSRHAKQRRFVPAAGRQRKRERDARSSPNRSC